MRLRIKIRKGIFVIGLAKGGRVLAKNREKYISADIYTFWLGNIEFNLLIDNQKKEGK